MIKSKNGFTLTEILISIVILSILGSLLVLMLSHSVRMWETVESNKNLQSRAQYIFDRIQRDLNNIRIIYDDEEKQGKIFRNYELFYFYCFQGKNGAQRLLFTRSQDGEILTTKIRSPLAIEIGAIQQPLFCVCYLINPHTQGQLLRGVFPFGMRTKDIINENTIKREEYLKANFLTVGEGVLFLGFNFKTSLGKPKRTSKTTESYFNLPIWDSTRVLNSKFKFHKREITYADPSLQELIEPVMPDEVEVVLGLSQTNTPDTTLKEDITNASKSINIFDTERITDVIKYLKIEDEMVEIKSKTGSKIELETRGAFYTTPTAHKKDTPVYSVVIFKKTFPLHIYKGNLEED